MKLSATEQKVLDYLHSPRTAQQVQDHLGHQMPPYKILRLLQRLDLVDKEGAHDKAKSTYVASGRPMHLEPDYMSATPVTVLGVRLG